MLFPSGTLQLDTEYTAYIVFTAFISGGTPKLPSHSGILTILGKSGYPHCCSYPHCMGFSAQAQERWEMKGDKFPLHMKARLGRGCPQTLSP